MTIHGKYYLYYYLWTTATVRSSVCNGQACFRFHDLSGHIGRWQSLVQWIVNDQLNIIDSPLSTNMTQRIRRRTLIKTNTCEVFRLVEPIQLLASLRSWAAPSDKVWTVECLLPHPDCESCIMTLSAVHLPARVRACQY